jgi:hypothetical protein
MPTAINNIFFIFFLRWLFSGAIAELDALDHKWFTCSKGFFSRERPWPNNLLKRQAFTSR